MWQQSNAAEGTHLLSKLGPTACLEICVLGGVKASSSNCIHHLICSLGVLVHNADLQQTCQASVYCGHSGSFVCPLSHLCRPDAVRGWMEGEACCEVKLLVRVAHDIKIMSSSLHKHRKQ